MSRVSGSTALPDFVQDHPKPFWEHLEEFRRRLLKSMLSILIGALASYQFTDFIFSFLARPVGQLIFIHPTEAFFVRMKLALVAGVLLMAPVVLYQVWRFVAIALTPEERGVSCKILPLSYLLFLLGFFFGFLFLVPTGTRFLLGYGTEFVVPKISVEYYVNFAGTVCLVLGGVFQMPLVTFLMARFGLLRSEWLSQKRRVALLLIYILSAFLTPGPDPVTALLLAVPSYLLFECSILTAKFVKK